MRTGLFVVTFGFAAVGCAGPSTAQTVSSASSSGVNPAAARRLLVRRVLAHSVKLVLTEGGQVRQTASGVAIASAAGPRGDVTYVVTNAHAVDPHGLAHPTLRAVVDDAGDEQAYPAEALAVGSVPDLDLALVKVSGVRLSPATLAEDDELEPGESVVVAAAPFGSSVSVSGGMISQVQLERKSRVPTLLKTDAPVGYGASGGGIYSLSTGRLLAIVEGYRTAKVGFAVADKDYSFDVPMPGETFAAPAAKLRAFLKARGFEALLGAAAVARLP